MDFLKLNVVKGAYALIDIGGSTWPVPEYVCGKITDRMIGNSCEMGERDVESWRDGVAHLAQYIPENGEVFGVARETGYCMRLSAPGFDDCAEWSAFDKIDRLYRAALEMLGGPEDPGYASEVRDILEYASEEGMPLTVAQARYLESEESYRSHSDWGSVPILHCVHNEPYCAACAVQQMADGEPVISGPFEEGEPLECDACGVEIASNYGPVDDAGDDA